MSIGKICSREVVVATPETTVAEAAKLMRQHHVGNVVVVALSKGHARPTGIITDRDIVLSVVGTGLDPEVFTVGDMVTTPIVTAPEDQGIFETIQLVKAHGVRRIPIVNREGELAGIVTIDDLIQLLSEELSEIGKLIRREQVHEARTRR